MAPGLSWPPLRVLPVPGAGVGTPFAGWGDTAGEAGGIFAKPPFELPAGGVGSAGLGAGTLCGGGCWFVCGLSCAKSSGTGTPCVSTTGSFLVTSNVLFSSVGTISSAGFSPLAFALVFEPESPSEPESPAEPESPSEPKSSCEYDSPPEIELPRKFAVLTEFKSTFAGRFLSTNPFSPPTLVVPVLGISVNAIGTPNVLTGHGGGGVMKVGSGLGCPGKIVVV